MNNLFAKAEMHKVHIERRSVSDDELTDLMRAEDHMVVALVDRRLIDRPTASVSGIVETCMSYCFGGYIGHYVLLLRHDSIAAASLSMTRRRLMLGDHLCHRVNFTRTPQPWHGRGSPHYPVSPAVCLAGKTACSNSLSSCLNSDTA